MTKKIFITGGHFAPAKAVISQLQKRGGWKIFYVGRKTSMEGDRAEALEFREIGGIGGIRYLVITTGRLQRRFFVNVGQSIKALLKIPVGFVQAFWWLARYNPNVVLSFGGYVAVPVVFGAWLLDIPVATHEQTKSMGLVNRVIRLLGAKVLDTGNPLREEILEAANGKRQTASNLLYITGGNQGSHVINQAVLEIIPQLIKKYQIVHQTGDSAFRDFERAGTYKRYKNYKFYKFLAGEESAKVLGQAKIVISRAGANTIEELAYLGKPSILIPIPWSSGDEQTKNAQTLANIGMAEIIPQDKLSGEVLLEVIEKIEKNYSRYSTNAEKGRSLVHPDAAKEIVKEVEKLI